MFFAIIWKSPILSNFVKFLTKKREISDQKTSENLFIF